ncbi:Endo-1,4-beta-glucanase [Chitinispirillum alkaliphilum]|nr:Endo-1,4-beta-glucanase [Chitinispirillum alkaliphilum]
MKSIYSFSLQDQQAVQNLPTLSKLSLLWFIILLIFSCNTKNVTGQTFTPQANTPQNSFFQVQGNQILSPDGSPFQIMGVAFGNQVWHPPPHPPPNHHDRIDYGRAAAMGFNTVRFYLDYRLFEEDYAPYLYKESGFEWIDQNIQWAKEHGISLILNMHYPQGGFQSLERGGALWSQRSNQKRLIARRYKNKPQILGFDLVNEPVVTESIDQWINLANEIVTSIREVNPNHITIIERLNANLSRTNDPWNPNQNGEMNFFLIDDPNLIYQFHFTHPSNLLTRMLPKFRQLSV